MPMMAKKSPWFFKTKARIKEMTVTPKPRSKPITRRAKTPPSPAAMRTPKINPKPNRITHWSVVLILTARKRPTRIEAREIGVLIKRKREPFSLSKSRGMPPAMLFPKAVRARIPGKR